MRYTQYDRDLGRWVVPCLYKVDGEKITFFVKYEPGETVKNNKGDQLLTPGYELVFGEVIDHLAKLENNSERMTELLLKREDMMSKLAKEKQEYFDLIKRQQAEIEKVKPIYNSFEAELECAKSEAIKEFAEKLKEHYFWDLEQAAIFEEDIDNLVKEMTEGKDAGKDI